MFGCLPDPPDTRDRSVELLGLATTPPSDATVQRLMAPIANQLNTSSCVGQALRQAYNVAEYAKTGSPPKPTSALGHYFDGRAQHGTEKVDAGTWVRAAMTGLKYFGALREHDWPFDAARVNDRPPWRAYKAAYKTKGPHAYYRIDGFGDERLDAIRRCIASEKGAVVLGTKVTEAFTENDGPDTEDTPKAGQKIAGGHAMAVIAYEPGRFLLANSWGTAYRLNGCIWVTEDYVAWSGTHDIWALVL
jgi:hypothetical protein